jgi:hypothetical protein
LQRTSVQNDRTGLASPLLRHPQYRAQIIDHRLETACLQPAFWVYWYTSSHGGKFVGSMRHDAPARAIQRSALNI